MKNIWNCKFYYHYQTQIGEITVGTDSNNLVLVKLEKIQIENAILKNHPICEMTFIQIQEYFQNKRKEFDLPLKISGSDNFQRVLNEISKIEYGQFKSYKQIANILNSKAYRYIGSCCKNNPILIVIPCHRVISKNNPYAYVYGSDIKKKLINLENINFK